MAVKFWAIVAFASLWVIVAVASRMRLPGRWLLPKQHVVFGAAWQRQPNPQGVGAVGCIQKKRSRMLSSKRVSAPLALLGYR